MGNVLHRNLRTDSVRECNFIVFGGTNLENETVRDKLKADFLHQKT